MTAVVQAPIELGSAWGLRAGQVAVGRGWQRAIDKASGDSWFLGALGRPHAAAAFEPSSFGRLPPLPVAMEPRAAPSPDAPNGSPLVAGPIPPPGAAMPAVVGLGSRLRCAAMAPVVQPTAPKAPEAETPCAVTDIVLSRGAERLSPHTAEPEPVTPKSQRPHASPQEPEIHVHIEQQADGLHLWLGAPAQATGALLRSIDLPALQRVLPGRVAGVVCNGVPVDPGSVPSRPTSSPGLAGHNQEP
jgi:hypothetical protein